MGGLLSIWKAKDNDFTIAKGIPLNKCVHLYVLLRGEIALKSLMWTNEKKTIFQDVHKYRNLTYENEDTVLI